ncbi:MAG: hypothetical protein AB7N91_25260 [Candidatus Tectimicrobiota bacterium]
MKRWYVSLCCVIAIIGTVGLALAGPPPPKVVEQFIEAHLQGRFAESRSLALERVNLSTSPFSNWIFGTAASGGNAATADLFLSRKFSQAFRYAITSTTPTGDNQVYVAVIRNSPSLAHMYTWALAPKRGASPYELVDAIDTYLTKVNFPLEESRMQFTLVREVDSWYISAVLDEKFVQLQQQLQGQTVLAGPPSAGPAAAAVGSTLPAVTTTSSDLGRQVADAQFHATLQGFNLAAQGLPAGSPGSPGQVQQAAREEDEPGLLGKIGRAIFGKSKESSQLKLANTSARGQLNNIRDALSRYWVSNNTLPDNSVIHDWKTLQRVVNRYGATSLPATEDEAGFTFISYELERTRDSYILLVDLKEPQDGVKRVEVRPHGVEKAN